MSRRLYRLVPMLLLIAVAMALPPATASSGAWFASDVELPDRTEAVALKSAPRYVSVGERAALLALRVAGTPYRWGGESPEGGFDCSGLIRWAYGRLGVDVPHSSYALWSTGKPVVRSRMQVGDVLVFSGLGHVGLYVGNGHMVHSPYSGKAVEVVSLASTNYGSRLVGVRRVSRV